eukprot:1163383-Pleurochrysis_carterae.AAC.1
MSRSLSPGCCKSNTISASVNCRGPIQERIEKAAQTLQDPPAEPARFARAPVKVDPPGGTACLPHHSRLRASRTAPPIVEAQEQRQITIAIRCAGEL